MKELTDAELRCILELGPSEPVKKEDPVDWSKCPLAKRYPRGVYPGTRQRGGNYGSKKNRNRDLE